MKLLAIDTTTEACSAALLIDDNIQEIYELAPQRHTELILVMIDRLCADAQLSPSQLDGLAFSCGPGSFSGVRIGSSVIQALAFAADLRVAPVSSLAALAQNAFEETNHTHILSAIDARMREVYSGFFDIDEEQLVRAISAEHLGLPTAITPPLSGPWLGCGSGWDTYPSELRACLDNRVTEVMMNRFPRAACVAKLGVSIFRKGETVEAEYAQPVYLRNDVVQQPAKGAPTK